MISLLGLLSLFSPRQWNIRKCQLTSFLFSCCSAVVFFLGTFLLMIMAVLDTFFLLYQQRKSLHLDKALRSFQKGKTTHHTFNRGGLGHFPAHLLEPGWVSSGQTVPQCRHCPLLPQTHTSCPRDPQGTRPRGAPNCCSLPRRPRDKGSQPSTSGSGRSWITFCQFWRRCFSTATSSCPCSFLLSFL